MSNEYIVRLLFVCVVISTYALFTSLENVFLKGFDVNKIFDFLIIFIFLLSLLEVYWILSNISIKEKTFSVLRFSSYAAIISYYTNGNLLSLIFSFFSFALIFYIAFKVDEKKQI